MNLQTAVILSDNGVIYGNMDEVSEFVYFMGPWGLRLNQLTFLALVQGHIYIKKILRQKMRGVLFFGWKQVLKIDLVEAQKQNNS